MTRARWRILRSRAPCPIASCETLCGRRDFKPFFEAYAMDVPIIDVPWNGLAELVKIAAMADAYEMNVAPHNFYGHLCSMHSAHFCAVRAELPHHGARSRQRLLARRVRHRRAHDRERRAGVADRAGLGHRRQREGGAGPAAERLSPWEAKGVDHPPARMMTEGTRPPKA